MGKPHKGFFKPRNAKKYKGDPTKIIYRSSWECRFMMYLDANPNILQWASEEFSIPYMSPIDGKIHRYFPDFWVKIKDTEGNIKTLVVEIKPKVQMQPPTPSKKRTKRYISEVAAWRINSAKWKAASQYCLDRKWDFKVLNEHDLGIVNDISGNSQVSR